MYDIRQFRPTLFLLLALGMTGFCLAARSPGLWVLSMAALAAHWVLRGKGILRPLPNWAAAGVALMFGLLTFSRFRADPASALLTAGQFLVFLQLVKVYQEGAGLLGSGGTKEENKNYAWLLVLSLLLMVAASISTASLAFGLVLIAYLFLGLYCCLLFHLKAETESVRAAMVIPADVVNPAVLRQDERSLPSSMRRLTALVAGAGLACAVLVFVFFPRGPGAGILGQLNLRPAQAMTGFSESVSFESVARIQQSTEVAGYIRITVDGEPLKTAEPLYLRGVTLDYYSGDGRDDGPGSIFQGGAPWQWSRTPSSIQPQIREGGGGTYQELAGTGEPALAIDGADSSDAVGGAGTGAGQAAGGGITGAVEGRRTYLQVSSFKPTGTNVVFSLAGLYGVTFDRDVRYAFSPADETLRVTESGTNTIEYTAVSRGVSGWVGRPGDPLPRFVRPPSRSRIDPRIADYARKAEVSGTDTSGALLSRKRGTSRRPNALDLQIAENIERHLKSDFSYTLDLTNTTRRPGEDPIVQFLYETKKGHCEYFAGAMVLLCQSLGIDARMVTGFRAEEYNALMGRYVVRQSDAHAWVEVRYAERGKPDRWVRFDPTSSREETESRTASAFSRVRRLIDYLEYTWADTVVAYNRDRRENLLGSVGSSVASTATQAQKAVRSWDDLLPQPSQWWVSPKLVGAIIGAMVLAAVGAIGAFLWERRKLRRRADRIGLGALPDDAKLRLARQLGFYDDLLQMLAARGHTRPASQTPLEFSNTLAHLPSEAFDAVRRLTRIYYRIRYGKAELDPAYQRRVRDALSRLEPALGPLREK